MILRWEGKILICRRGAGGNCAYLWEFPGGKREPGETLEQCAVRECMEELGVQIALHNWPRQFSYRYPEREIAFTFFDGEITGGHLEPKVHIDVRWVTPAELLQYEFCPADVELVRALAEGR